MYGRHMYCCGKSLFGGYSSSPTARSSFVPTCPPCVQFSNSLSAAIIYLYFPRIPSKRRYNKGNLGSGGFCEV